jgi:hypothetical protein
MSRGVDFDFNSGTGYLHDGRAFVSIEGLGSGNTLGTPGAGATNPKPRKTTDAKKWSPWGADNNFPQTVIDLVSKSTVAPAALKFKIKSIYGKGIVPVKVQLDPDGKEILSPVDDSNVKAFFKANDIRKFLREMITDYVWFGNVFPEVILNKRRNRILNIYSNEATYSRWEKINQSSGRIENCYVSANWPSPRPEEIIKVAVADPYDLVGSIQAGSAYKYIIPVSNPSPGKSFYQLVEWDGARSNGWIEVANEIPRFKKAMFNNQMTLKYHIKIPYEYWEKKFSAIGNKLTDEQKKAAISEELQKLNEFLRGSDKAGISFVSHFGTDPVTKKEYAGWQIEPLDDKIKDGKWLPDSAAANSEILFAMQVDPSLMGAGMPGGPYSGSAGSGSDKRESFLIQTALLQTDRDTILEPLHLIRDFNGWDPDIQFRFVDSILTTLDKGKGTEKVLS